MFRKTLLASLLIPIGLIPFLQPQAAWACSCLKGTPDEQLERADVVFTGRVVEKNMPTPDADAAGGLNWVQWTFEVEADQKGSVPETVTVESASNGAACGINFQIGERYQVFANQSNTALRASLCSGTKVLTEEPEEQSQGSAPCKNGHGSQKPLNSSNEPQKYIL